MQQPTACRFEQIWPLRKPTMLLFRLGRWEQRVQFDSKWKGFQYFDLSYIYKVYLYILPFNCTSTIDMENIFRDSIAASQREEGERKGIAVCSWRIVSKISNLNLIYDLLIIQKHQKVAIHGFCAIYNHRNNSCKTSSTTRFQFSKNTCRIYRISCQIDPQEMITFILVQVVLE